MSFSVCDGKTGKIIDIVEDRKLKNLLKYFSYYSHNVRNTVKFIVIDMFSPYFSLIKKIFPNAKIIIDKFHIIQLIPNPLNKTRIAIMKKNKKNYNKLKRYWKLILKTQEDLDNSEWKKSIKTLKGYISHIKNTLSAPYNNGFIEGNNNFIKVLKRIAFGFRSFRRFKARIMIYKNLLHAKKANAI